MSSNKLKIKLKNKSINQGSDYEVIDAEFSEVVDNVEDFSDKGLLDDLKDEINFENKNLNNAYINCNLTIIKCDDIKQSINDEREATLDKINEFEKMLSNQDSSLSVLNNNKKDRQIRFNDSVKELNKIDDKLDNLSEKIQSYGFLKKIINYKDYSNLKNNAIALSELREEVLEDVKHNEEQLNESINLYSEAKNKYQELKDGLEKEESFLRLIDEKIIGDVNIIQKNSEDMKNMLNEINNYEKDIEILNKEKKNYENKLDEFIKNNNLMNLDEDKKNEYDALYLDLEAIRENEKKLIIEKETVVENYKKINKEINNINKNLSKTIVEKNSNLMQDVNKIKVDSNSVKKLTEKTLEQVKGYGLKFLGFVSNIVVKNDFGLKTMGEDKISTAKKVFDDWKNKKENNKTQKKLSKSMSQIDRDI